MNASRPLARTGARRQRASALVETLLAAPIVLLLGLGALQWALLFQARSAVEYALFEAARAGSVAQARPEAIEAGLARGLMPFWQGPGTPRSLESAWAASRLRLGRGIAAGWIAWRQIAPTGESFDDWAEPARDALGRPIAGVDEIPNDSLQWASLRTPSSAGGSTSGGAPIGARSQQTLTDANLLKIELRYGVPMTVPLVGALAVWWMRVVDGCAPPARRRVGLVELGSRSPSTGLPPTAPRAWACPIYLAPDASGRPVARWPVRVAATVRMQSAARRSVKTPHRTESAVRSAAAAPGAAYDRDAAPAGGASPAIDAPTAPVRVGADGDGSLAREASGWLDVGGERTFSVPGACDA